MHVSILKRFHLESHHGSIMETPSLTLPNPNRIPKAPPLIHCQIKFLSSEYLDGRLEEASDTLRHPNHNNAQHSGVTQEI